MSPASESALRRAARRVLTPNARFMLQTQLNQWRATGPAHWLRWNAMLANAWCRDRTNRSTYTLVSESELIASRKSKTVFVFGSGASLNDLSAEEWRHFSNHDVFGFNAFFYEQWIPVGFHLLRGGVYGELEWRSYAETVSGTINGNSHFRNTIFLMQGEYLAQFCNQLLGFELLYPGARVYRYHTARADGPPTASLRDGVRHVSGTLSDAVNCAHVLGWSEIVLVGVDLYDSRYFWLPPDQTPNLDRQTGALSAEFNATRGTRYDDRHYTVHIGILDLMESWATVLAARGCSLQIYNPRSLLAAVLPVYARDRVNH